MSSSSWAGGFTILFTINVIGRWGHLSPAPTFGRGSRFKYSLVGQISVITLNISYIFLVYNYITSKHGTRPKDWPKATIKGRKFSTLVLLGTRDPSKKSNCSLAGSGYIVSSACALLFLFYVFFKHTLLGQVFL